MSGHPSQERPRCQGCGGTLIAYRSQKSGYCARCRPSNQQARSRQTILDIGLLRFPPSKDPPSI